MRARYVVMAALTAGYVGLYRLGARWGATEHELHRRLPGDDLLPSPSGQTTHAITINARPEDVWPWIIQMGYHRGGWYTYPWVDRYLWHIQNPSADHIIEELQHVTVGDVIPDGEPGTAWYRVEQLQKNRFLVLRSTSHLPPSLRDKAWVDWTWSFVLEPLAGRATRLILRVRATGSAPVMAAFHLLIVPSDLVMARSMLRGIKARAEGMSPIEPAGGDEDRVVTLPA